MSLKSQETRKLEDQAISGSQPESAETSAGSLRHEEIRIRAYEIYIERGGQTGHELDDWLQAERELEPKVRHARAGQ